jgi:hypothetical protein
MALKPLLSFASGELDPALTDNVTLEKYNKGLSAARNIMIGKTGSILSRFSRAEFKEARDPNKKIKLFVYDKELLLEWGHQYVIGHFVNSYLTFEFAHALTEDDLDNMHFVSAGRHVYVFVEGKTPLKLFIDGPYLSGFVPANEVFEVPNAPASLGNTAVGAPAGYDVFYLATFVVNGEESLPRTLTSGTIKKPIAAGQSNQLTATWIDDTPQFSNIKTPSEMRVYSRPKNGGAYGLLGISTDLTLAGTTWTGKYEDVGSNPDFTQGVPDIITKFGLFGTTIENLKPKTGGVYQQRLLLTTNLDPEALLASRPGYQNNFYRDFPYDADSSLQFKAGTSGRANILRILESDGLVLFTTNGVYINFGLLSVNNLAFERKGPWIIKEELPPLVVPGGVFFVDTNNVIRQLVFSQEIAAYESLEQTIFSNHIFRNRVITSWTFQDGIVPIIIVTFSDGDWATFTYNFEHQMRAWTRHDSTYPIEQVESSPLSDTTYFVINKNGTRHIEVSLPRYVPADEVLANPEAKMLAANFLMDGIRSSSYLLNNGLNPGANFVLTPVVSGDWSGDLTLRTSDNANFFEWNEVGNIFRFFHPVDGSVVDLEIVVKTNDTLVTVTPSATFPSQYGTSARIYSTFNVIFGLQHLEGENVSVVVDGALVASPLNDVGDYPVLTVAGGMLTLPDDMMGAFVIVGRPIVADVKTLNITTVEQAPTLIESVNVNKLYVRVNESRGLYCANDFPEEMNDEKDGYSVIGMDSLDEALVPRNDILLGNTYLKPVSKRCEKIIPGTWENQGQIAIRQVDPFHFEILSIIPDVEVERRSDR